jgi:hypothetical protein
MVSRSDDDARGAWPPPTRVVLSSHRVDGDLAHGCLTLGPVPSSEWVEACDVHLDRFRRAFQAHAEVEGDRISFRVAAHDLDRSQLALLQVVAHVDRTMRDAF